MARIVMKFGGTSVADLDRIRSVAARVKRQVEDSGDEVAVVVSAMSGDHQPAGGVLPGAVSAARRARVRRRRRDRRAGDQRAAGDRAADAGGRVALVARLAGAGGDRRRARQGADRGDRRVPADPAAGGRAGPGGGRLPGARPRQPRHHAGARRLRHLGGGAGGGIAGGSLRHLYGCGRDLHHRPADRAQGAPARQDRLRGDAGAGLGGCQGAADAIGRARDEGAGPDPGAVELRPRGGAVRERGGQRAARHAGG